MCYRLGAVWRERGGRQFVTETLVTSYNLDWGLTRLGNNFIFVQPDLGPPNFFMGMSQEPLDISQNTF